MATLAAFVGTLALVGSALRLGFTAELFSKPVLTGYISGLGLTLLSSQLGKATGIPIHAESFFPRITEFVRHLDQAKPITVAVGLGTLAFLLAMRKLAPRAPAALIGVSLATALSVALDLPKRGLRVGSPVPSELPRIHWPSFSFDDLRALAPTAIGLVVVAYTDNVLTARSVAAKQGYRIESNRELAALGVTNWLAALSGGFPISAAASRTVVPASLGSKTQLVSIAAAIFVVASMLGLGPVLSQVPEAALAAVVLAAGIGIIEVEGFERLYRVSRLELVIAALGALAVMLLGVLDGVLLAVGASGLVAFGRIALPHDAVLARSKDLEGWVDARQYHLRTTEGLLVYRFDAPLFFANANRYRERVLEMLELNPGREEWIVLDFEGIGEVDATALEMLAELAKELASQEIFVAVARANTLAEERLRRAGLVAPEGPMHPFATIQLAVAAFRDRTGRRTLAPTEVSFPFSQREPHAARADDEAASPESTNTESAKNER
jgi:MFS superfamily sulfate permease-like transporter